LNRAVAPITDLTATSGMTPSYLDHQTRKNIGDANALPAWLISGSGGLRPAVRYLPETLAVSGLPIDVPVVFVTVL
jgi:hypothetical protein